MNRKLFLIPIDSTPSCSYALSYISMMFAEDPEATFHLLHCQTQKSESILPQPVDSDASLLPDTLYNSTQTTSTKQLIQRKTDFLHQGGINRESVKSSFVSSGNNVARSLISEAEKQLPDSVVIARRGVGFIGEMVMGSLSASLFRDLHSIPLWIIDGNVISRDVLVAVDGSIYSLRAVEHLSYILKNRTDINIYLYHCQPFLAPAVICSLDSFYLEWEHDWCDQYLSGDGCLFKGPAQLLLEAGIPQRKIAILPETSNIEESTSIISQARKHNCGTIVIGRKGPDSPKGFFGGVSNRTIRQTQNMAVWIVG